MGDRTDMRYWEKPLFNNARGFLGPNWVAPPIEFLGVTMRVFPLRADMETLQRIIDSALNSSFLPEKAGHFRVFLPYVYLMVIDYGKMSALARSLGWTSQREMSFSIPLEWYRLEGPRFVFHDWAWTSPIIFVDEEESMSTGREVYGWPKSMARLGMQASDWVRDPLALDPIVSISTQVLDTAYAGQRYHERVFLEVERNVTETQLRLGPNSLLLPWVGIPNAIQNFTALLGDSARFLRRQFLTPDASERLFPESTARMQARVAAELNVNSNIYFNTVNLKQFRAVSSPHLACYKALVNARMEVERTNRMGVLGDVRILQGDTSGGYRIRLHSFPSLSLAETFGLEGERQQIGDRVAWTVRPVMPFWLDVDMLYNRARNVTWNAGSWRETPRPRHTLHSQKWQTPFGKEDPSLERSRLRSSTDSSLQESHESLMHIHTTDGTVAQQITGPFDFPNTTVRVLPLLADRQRLEKFCDAYLTQELAGTGMSVKPWGDYVYLLITNYEEMSSLTNNVGWWANHEVMFCLPVRRYVNGVLSSVALVPVFCYADSVIAANTGAEVNGLPMTYAVINSPKNVWMDSAGPSETTPRSLMELRTRVMAALDQNQPMEERLLLDVWNGDTVEYNDDYTQRFVIADWGQRLKGEVHRKKQAADKSPLLNKDARALVLETLANQGPINYLTFKQFRDADEPERACYQSLVELTSEIYKVYDVREMDAPLHVRVHQYPTHPIVETLGLHVKNADSKGEGLVYNLEAIRPFWMRVGLRTMLGRSLCWRANTKDWVMASGDRERTYFRRSRSSPPPSSNKRPTRKVCFDPDTLPGWQKLHMHVSAWKKQKRGRKYLLSAARARKVVKTFEPQMAIEMALSREWEHWGDPHIYQAKEQISKELDKAYENRNAKDVGKIVEKAKGQTPVKEFRHNVDEAFKAYKNALAAEEKEPSKKHQQLNESAEKLTAALLRCWQMPDFYVRATSLKEFRVVSKGKEEYWDYWRNQPVWYMGPDLHPEEKTDAPPPPRPQVNEKKS